MEEENSWWSSDDDICGDIIYVPLRCYAAREVAYIPANNITR